MRKKDLGKKVAKYFRMKANAKRAYQRADKLLDELVKATAPGEKITLPDGDTAVVKDVYAESNRVFRAHGIGRYELERYDGVTGKRVTI